VVAPHGEAARNSARRRDRARRTTRCEWVRSGARARDAGTHAGHISYFFPADKLAFVGDTLFSIGCGRVIEGTPEMMWQSLLKLRGLPDDARIYCGHEYTKANISFAKTIEPTNAALNAREREVDELLAAGQPTIPSTMAAEKAAKPVPACGFAGGGEIGGACGHSGLESVR